MSRCLEISVPQTLRYHELYVNGGKKSHGDLLNLILEIEK